MTTIVPLQSFYIRKETNPVSYKPELNNAVPMSFVDAYFQVEFRRSSNEYLLGTGKLHGFLSKDFILSDVVTYLSVNRRGMGFVVDGSTTYLNNTIDYMQYLNQDLETHASTDHTEDVVVWVDDSVIALIDDDVHVVVSLVTDNGTASEIVAVADFVVAQATFSNATGAYVSINTGNIQRVYGNPTYTYPSAQAKWNANDTKATLYVRRAGGIATPVTNGEAFTVNNADWRVYWSDDDVSQRVGLQTSVAAAVSAIAALSGYDGQGASEDIQALANMIRGLEGEMDSVEDSVSSLDSRVTANGEAITGERSARVAADSSLSQRITALEESEGSGSTPTEMDETYIRG